MSTTPPPPPTPPASPPVTITAAARALRQEGHRLSEQTLRNWIQRRGLPSSRDARGALTVRVSDVRHYLGLYGQRRLDGRGHGGKRQGAGRKPAANQTPLLPTGEALAQPTTTLAPPTPATTAPSTTPAPPAISAAPPASAQPGSAAAFGLDAKLFKMAGIPAGVLTGTNGSAVALADLSIDELEKLERLAKAAKNLMDVRVDAGELLERDDVDHTWGEALVEIRRRIQAIPRRCRAALQSALSLTSTAASRAAEEVERECRRVLAELEAGIGQEPQP